jgi:chromate reductase, NAD(P)H dehydrogenase (quinone)
MGKILAFSGSSRKGSYNKMLLRYAVEGAEKAGAKVTVIDFKDYVLPVYNGDLEQAEGLPEKVKELKQLFLEHDALLIASPEYNSMPSALLKNVIDWVSRPLTKDEPFLHCFLGKKAALLSASIGYLGGSRGLIVLASMLRNIMVTVLPEFKMLPMAQDHFDDQGNFKEQKHADEACAIGEVLAKSLN